jgi:hypothetical protein
MLHFRNNSVRAKCVTQELSFRSALAAFSSRCDLGATGRRTRWAANADAARRMRLVRPRGEYRTDSSSRRTAGISRYSRFRMISRAIVRSAPIASSNAARAARGCVGICHPVEGHVYDPSHWQVPAIFIFACRLQNSTSLWENALGNTLGAASALIRP